MVSQAIRLFGALPKTTEAQILGKQVLRSGTSVGANYSEAHRSRSKRDTVNLDIFWLKDESLEESANLPAPEVIAEEITADLEQFATIAEDLKR